MKYRLQDLIDIDHFQELQDRLNEIYSFPSSIIDNDGNILTATAWQEICLQFHRKSRDSEKLCIKSDQYIKDHIYEANPALTYHCPHGLVDNATPIIIDGVHYGNFFTGQFFLKEPDLEFFRARAQKYGFDEEAYLRAVKKVPVWTQKQLDSYLFFIKGLITVLSESGLKKLKEIENRERTEKSEKRYRSILKAAMDGCWLTDTKGRLLEVNDAYCRMSGYSEDELLSMHISDLELVETPDLVAEQMQKVILKGADRFESQHRRKDGTAFDVEVSIKFRAEDGGQCVCFLRDITDRRLAEKALYENSKTLKEAQSVAKIGSWWYDQVTQIPTWTEEMFHIFGLEPQPQAVPYGEHRKIVHPDDWELFDRAVTNAVKDGTGYNLELRITRPSGEIRYVNARCVAEKNDDGVVTRLIGTTQDITERKQAEEALSKSEEKLRHLVHNLHAGVVVHAPDTRILLANEQAALLLGLSVDQMMGRTAIDPAWGFVREDYSTMPLEEYPVNLVITTRTPLPYQVVGINRPKTHDLVWVQVSAFPEFDAHRNLIQVVVTFVDVTERKQAQESLEQLSQRLELATKSAKIGIWDWDVVSNHMTWDDRMLDLYGYTRENFPGGVEAWDKGLHPEDKEKAWDECRAALGGEKEFNTEFRVLRPDGTMQNLKADGMVMRDADGKPLRMLGINYDITDRRQAEDKIKESEEKYRKLYEDAAIGIFHSNFEGRFLDVNPALAKMLGYEAPQEVLDSIHSIAEQIYVEPQTRDEFINQLVATGEVIKVENLYRRKDGSEWNAYLYLRYVSDSNGQPICLEGFVQDITDQKKSEAALKESEARFKALHNASFGGIAIHDKGIILECNKGMSELTEYTYNELIGMDGLYLISDDTRDLVIANINSGYEEPYEATGVRKNGEKYPLRLEARNIPYQGKEVRVVEFRDITDQKKSEAALRKSEEKYRLIAENMSDVVSIMDLNLRFTYVSSSIKHLSGFTSETFINHSVEEIMPPEYFEKIMKVFGEEMMMETSGKADPYRTRIIEFEQYTIDHSTVWVEASCSFLRDSEKRAAGVLVISRNISDRKQAEVERERLMAAVEQSGDAIVVTDINGVIQYVNPAFQKVTGYTWDEAIHRNPSLLKSGRQDKTFYQNLWETVSSGQTWSGRMVNKKKDGSLYTEDATISPVFDSSGKIINFVAVKKDVTEHLRLSAQVQQAQKLESIGTLAGGIAHDFNNILTSVIGYTELALVDVEKGSPAEDYLQEIYTAGMRARDLVKQILAFARQSDDAIKPVQIDTIAKEALSLIRASIPATIRIDQKIQKNLTIMGNSTQIHQVLMNVCTNAAHAMEDNGGILEVSIKAVAVDQNDGLKDLVPGEYAEIKISDTGAGIDPAIMDKIFDPFFTTKDTGKGTGMGLALVHGIIKSYNGTITAESELGQGSVFTIYLPLIRSLGESESYQPGVLPTGDEKILLIDDESAIAKMSSQLLQKLGYEVVFQTSSMKALDLFRSNPDDFDLVITDMTMPEITGDKLAVELIKIRRDIPVILCTGYSTKISDKTAATIGIKAFAYKPLSRADLAKTVRNVLDEAKSTARH